MRVSWVLWAGAAVVAISGGCATVLGLGDFEPSDGGGGDGATATTPIATTTTQSSASNATTVQSTATTSVTSTISSSSTGTFCVANQEMITCYDGNPAMANVGTCRRGMATCLPDGSAFGECLGDVLPLRSDDCSAMMDTNCDGTLTCQCQPGTMMGCYDGTPGTEVHPPCKVGTRTCDANGQGFGACMDQVTDKPTDDCSTNADENCDGVVNDLCVCVPNSSENCYTGPAATQNVGPCRAGTWTCNATGTAWGQCMNEVLPKPENCDLLGDEDCSGSGCGDAVWSKLLPTDQAEDYPLTESVDSDFQGGLLVAGVLVAPGNIDINGAMLGPVYVAKYDANGAVSWSKALPNVINRVWVASSAASYVYGTFQTSMTIDGTLLTSAGSDDVFLAAYNSLGTLLWARSFGGAGSEEASDVAVGGGALAISGTFAGSVTFPGTSTLNAIAGRDSFIVKINPLNGNPTWSRAIGDVPNQPANEQTVNAVAIDAGGSVYAGGTFRQSIRLAGSDANASGFSDAFLTKYNSAGSAQWGRIYGGVSSDAVEEIAVDSAGAIGMIGYVGGSVNFGGGALPYGGGSLDSYVAKIDTNGAHVWSLPLAGPGLEQGRDIDFDGTDNVLVAGDFNAGIVIGPNNVSNASSNVFFAKFNGAGAYLWSRTMLTPARAFYPYIASVPMGRIAVAFTNQATVDLGNGLLNAANGQDTLVIGILNP